MDVIVFAVLMLAVAIVATVPAIAVLVRRGRMSPEKRERLKERNRRNRRDLAQWGASLVVLGVFLSFAYFGLPQSSTGTVGIATIEMEPSAGSVVIALIAMLFAALATIRRRWARIVFGVPALGTGALLLSARLSDMSEVRDLGLEVGSGLYAGLAAGIAIALGSLLCIGGIATVRRTPGRRASRRVGTPLPPPPVPSHP